MPRAHLSKRLPDAEAIRLFAEHHIVQVRRRKNGEILAVKHSTFGWMSASGYYGLQKSHELADRFTRDPFKLAAFATLVIANKTILDNGGQTVLNKVVNAGGVNWTGAFQVLLFGPVGSLLMDAFAGLGEAFAKPIRDLLGIKAPPGAAAPPPSFWEQNPEVTKWLEAIAAAFVELELGPVLLSVL